MTDITPPPELVQQWRNEEPYEGLLSRAAQYGAGQELEAILKLAGEPSIPERDRYFDGFTVASIREERRPKPQTLNSIALQMLGTIERDAHYLPEITDTIRKALEALDD